MPYVFEKKFCVLVYVVVLLLNKQLIFSLLANINTVVYAATSSNDISTKTNQRKHIPTSTKRPKTASSLGFKATAYVHFVGSTILATSVFYIQQTMLITNINA